MSRMATVLLTVLALLALLALTACEEQEPDITPEEQVGAEQRPDKDEGGNGEGGGDGGGGGADATFVAVDLDWEEAPDSLPSGEVTLELVNDGNQSHDLTVEELDDEVVVDEIDGGESDTGTVELESGQEYTFYCSVPGHREAGMETTVTVE